MKPYLVSKVVDPDGVVLIENKPTAERRVVSEKTARMVISMLEGVVEKEKGGTAPKARMDEYRVARFWADARVSKIWGGTNEIMKDLIGRSMGLG